MAEKIPKFSEVVGNYQFMEAMRKAARQSCEDGNYDGAFFGRETNFTVRSDSRRPEGFEVEDGEKGEYTRTVYFDLCGDILVHVHFHPPHTTTMPSYTDLKGTNGARKRRVERSEKEGGSQTVNPIYIIGLVRGGRYNNFDVPVELRVYQEASDLPLDLNQLKIEETLKRLDEESNPEFFDGLAIGAVGHVPKRIGFNSRLARQLPNYPEVRDAYAKIETVFLNSLGEGKWYRTATVRFDPSEGFCGEILPEDLVKLKPFELGHKIPVIQSGDPEDVIAEPIGSIGKRVSEGQ